MYIRRTILTVGISVSFTCTMLIRLSLCLASQEDWRRSLRLSLKAGNGPGNVAIMSFPPREPFPFGPKALMPAKKNSYWVVEQFGDRSIKLFGEGSSLLQAISNPLSSTQDSVSRIGEGAAIGNDFMALDELKGQLWRWNGSKWRSVSLPCSPPEQIQAEHLLPINSEEILVVARSWGKGRPFVREESTLRLFLFRGVRSPELLPLPNFQQGSEVQKVDPYPIWADSERNLYWGIWCKADLTRILMSTIYGHVTRSFSMELGKGYRFGGVAGKWESTIGFVLETRSFEAPLSSMGMTILVDVNSGIEKGRLSHPVDSFGYPLVSKARQVQRWLTTNDGHCLVPVCTLNSWELWEIAPR